MSTVATIVAILSSINFTCKPLDNGLHDCGQLVACYAPAHNDKGKDIIFVAVALDLPNRWTGKCGAAGFNTTTADPKFDRLFKKYYRRWIQGQRWLTRQARKEDPELPNERIKKIIWQAMTLRHLGTLNGVTSNTSWNGLRSWSRLFGISASLPMDSRPNALI